VITMCCLALRRIVSASSSRKSGSRRIILRGLLTFADEGHISFRNVGNQSRHDAA